MFFGIRRSYMPIANLVCDLEESENIDAASDLGVLQHVCRSFEQLVQENKSTASLLASDQFRRLLLLQMISGSYIDSDDFDQLCQKIGMSFLNPCFYVCIMLFDAPLDDAAQADVEKRLRFTSDDGDSCCFCVSPDAQNAIGIMNTRSNDAERLQAFLLRIQQDLLSSYSVTIGLSRDCGSVLALSNAYVEAHAAIDYRLIKGKNTCILYGEICEDSAEMPAYPRKLLDNCVQCLHTWDAPAIIVQLQRLVVYMRSHHLSLQQAKCICAELSSSLLREMSMLGRDIIFDMDECFDVFSIAEYESVAELVDKIISFSQSVQNVILSHAGSDSLVEQSIRVMKDNISNAQFSLGSMAVQMGVTPQTLRRKFKTATGQTLNSYLVTLRIDRAKELLINSDLDVEAVCVECGYLDPSSFTRLFKTEIGMTPGKYREINRPQRC